MLKTWILKAFFSRKIKISHFIQEILGSCFYWNFTHNLPLTLWNRFNIIYKKGLLFCVQYKINVFFIQETATSSYLYWVHSRNKFSNGSNDSVHYNIILSMSFILIIILPSTCSSAYTALLSKNKPRWVTSLLASIDSLPPVI